MRRSDFINSLFLELLQRSRRIAENWNDLHSFAGELIEVLREADLLGARARECQRKESQLYVSLPPERRQRYIFAVLVIAET